MTTSLPPPLRARAFTLVELLVVIAIIGVLLSLLLPAMARVREGASRAKCLNNLRQIGTALQTYHQGNRTFPPGCLEWRPPGNTTNRQLAWSAFILPQLDQEPLWRQIDFAKTFDGPENATAAATVVSIYLCPSARDTNTQIAGRGRCDYGGIYGEKVTARPPALRRGTLYYSQLDAPTRLSDISDGASQTVIVAEDVGFMDGQWINGLNVFEQMFPINQGPSFDNEMRSDHPSGVHGVFCDGSARFLANGIRLDVVAALCSRAGGEVISGGDY